MRPVRIYASLKVIEPRVKNSDYKKKKAIEYQGLSNRKERYLSCPSSSKDLCLVSVTVSSQGTSSQNTVKPRSRFPHSFAPYAKRILARSNLVRQFRDQ